MSIQLPKWKKALIIIACIILVWGIIAAVPRVDSHGGVNPYRSSEIMLIAHRGGRAEMPENTLEAFYNAYSINSSVMMETDVSITADGRIIVCHDETLDRTTNVTGEIINWRYADLVAQEVDFGYANKTVDGARVVAKYKTGEYAPTPNIEVNPTMVTYPSGVSARHSTKFLVTTLEDLLDAFPNNLMSVEIKQSGEVGKSALDAVVAILRQKQAFGRVVIGSFHGEIYNYSKQLKKGDCPDLMFSPAVAGVAGLLVPSWFMVDLFFADKVSIMQVPIKQSGITVASRHFINTAHRHNIAVQFWTINNEDDMRYLIGLGADGIMTDYPSMLQGIIEE